MRILNICAAAACAALTFSAVSAGPAIAIRTAIDNCQNQKLTATDRIAACNQVIHTNLLTHPMLADLYIVRGNIYAENNQLDAAIADYDKALELKPGFADALHNRAILLERKQNAAAMQSNSATPGTRQPNGPTVPQMNGSH